jgi:hypothetical protein
MSYDDIILKKPGDPEENTLPRGVRLIEFGGRLVFVQRVGGRFMPLSDDEQKKLFKKHVK